MRIFAILAKENLGNSFAKLTVGQKRSELEEIMMRYGQINTFVHVLSTRSEPWQKINIFTASR